MPRSTRRPAVRPSLILASHSPRRRRLLRQIGFDVRVIPSGVEETVHPDHSPVQYVRSVSLQKAREVAQRLKKGIVVGADTEVVYRGCIFGKPVSASDARRMLRELSGRTHTVHTGVALVDAATGRSRTFVESTKVTFRRLSGAEIAAYVATGSPMDKAGAYGIQDDLGAVFIERVEGCFTTVVGFPLARFHRELERFQRDA
ncbi:MAG: Maf family protein [Bacteroidetes bacterium]|nr:Maf family protein [Bacteroidota bacterium]